MLSRRAAALVVATIVTIPCSAAAEESKTVALAKELVGLLENAKTDVAAARLNGSTDEFVAVMFFPGPQLLAISAKYAAPAIFDERLTQRNFREIYLDLNAATNPADRMVVEDLQADGLRPKSGQNEAADYFTKGTGERFAFDGQWRKRKMSEDEYMKVFAEADALYTRMLESVIAQFKKGS